MMMPITRRGALKGAALAGFPAIIPASVLGAAAPSKRINVGAIGVGRISRGHDMKEVLRHDDAHIVSVCDLDTRRLAEGQRFVDSAYAARRGAAYRGTRAHDDYRALLADRDVDAVLISTPDHQHARLAIDAVRAGKDVYLQKPAALTIAEGRAMVRAVEASGRILQIGSQQRGQEPWPQFHRACELVRNGRIGTVLRVEVGLPGDPAGPPAPAMPIPTNLNYDAWLGSTPEVYYTERRVHPQDSIDARPGWLRCEQFGAGMITGWGAHHIDIAHWGMDTELTGPVEIWGKAEFPRGGLWDVHGAFETHARYANGVLMTVSGTLPNGVKFIGDDGWIFVTRSGPVTASDPGGAQVTPLAASDPRILASAIGAGETRLRRTPEQHRDWLDAIKVRGTVAAPAEIGHRACSTCLLHWAAMKTGRRLRWDPAAERFVSDAAADKLLSRPQRAGYAIAV
ncbi:Gfo/Idh/MocA family oxidoreductase [Sphingomonas sp. BK235]|uniref:Gfo/Idh/MocA family protein n=1 Tax=Sphingomonas sp. BK235 TaxID=2512131 RepID=UPI00104553EA|nr:Gfo/Idh/MocA family oxidoreductase [Sphingomonas sp. BK235]TCP35073.1 putative dehydrogenase [Sphingomonas sp. BK235]